MLNSNLSTKTSMLVAFPSKYLPFLYFQINHKLAKKEECSINFPLDEPIAIFQASKRSTRELGSTQEQPNMESTKFYKI